MALTVSHPPSAGDSGREPSQGRPTEAFRPAWPIWMPGTAPWASTKAAMRESASRCASFHRPRSWDVLRPPSAGDGRSRPVELSPEGRGLAERAMAAVQAAEAPMIEAMAAAWREGADLAPGLVALTAAAEAAERGRPGEPVGGQGRPSIRAGGSGGAGRRG